MQLAGLAAAGRRRARGEPRGLDGRLRDPRDVLARGDSRASTWRSAAS